MVVRADEVLKARERAGSEWENCMGVRLEEVLKPEKLLRGSFKSEFGKPA